MIHRVELLEKIRLACFAFDTNGSGEIDVNELSKGLKSAEVAESLENIPACPIAMAPEEFFDMMDMEGTGLVSHEKFMLSMFRIMEHDTSQGLSSIQMDLNKLIRELGEYFGAKEAGFGSHALRDVGGGGLRGASSGSPAKAKESPVGEEQELIPTDSRRQRKNAVSSPRGAGAGGAGFEMGQGVVSLGHSGTTPR